MDSLPTPLPWLTLASIASGTGALALVRYLSRHRDQPGVGWFAISTGAAALFCLVYGAGLLAFDTPVREAFELLAWIALAWTGVPFLGFALAYTGRGRLVSSAPFRALLGVPVLLTLLAATNPVFGLLWTDFRVVPVLGHAGASYALQPAGYVLFVLGTASRRCFCSTPC